jgi:hypothetical protein
MAASSSNSGATVALLFAANDCEHGRELWAFPVVTAARELGSSNRKNVGQ